MAPFQLSACRLALSYSQTLITAILANVVRDCTGLRVRTLALPLRPWPPSPSPQGMPGARGRLSSALLPPHARQSHFIILVRHSDEITTQTRSPDRRAQPRNGRRAADNSEERALRVARIIEYFNKTKSPQCATRRD